MCIKFDAEETMALRNKKRLMWSHFKRTRRKATFTCPNITARFAIFIPMIIARRPSATPLPIYQVKVCWLWLAGWRDGEKSCLLISQCLCGARLKRDYVIFDARRTRRKYFLIQSKLTFSAFLIWELKKWERCCSFLTDK